MSVAKLNVEIGANVAALQKGLKQAERELKAFGRNMSSIGNQLSVAVSLPLAAIGISAIKAAGEMEALNLAMRSTFQSAGRSIGEAEKEMEALRKSAMAPGLDFPQAVKASIRLQSVGQSAEDARKTIEQIANAVAMTGGTAQNLESVTVQMSQMISKGKVLAQDLRIIQENLPAISGLMKKAFGTSNAEDLQKLGITGKEFVSKITAEMAKLPRVQGGISNSIVNAWAAVQQALANIGDTINKTFNVSGKLDQFANWVVGLADWFGNLSDTSKNVALYIAAIAIAAGPVIRVLGVVGQLSGSLVIGWQKMVIVFQKWIVVSSNTEATTGLIGWWKSLNTVMKANVIGITVVVVLALVAAFNSLHKEMSEQAKMAQTVSDVNTKASQNIVEESKRVDDLVGKIRSHTSSLGDKKRALDELQKISPQYFGGLKIEKGLIIGLAEAQRKYNESILLSATAKVAADAYIETQKRLLDTTGRLADAGATWQQSLTNAAKSMALGGPLFGKLIFDNKQAATETENFGKKTGELIAERERYSRVEQEARASLAQMTGGMGDATANTNNFAAATGNHTKKIKDAEVEYDGAIRRVGMWAQALLNLKSVQDAGRIAKPIQQLPQAQSTDGILNPVQSLSGAAEQGNAIASAMTKANVAIAETNTQFTTLAAILETTTGGPLEQMLALTQGIQDQFGGLAGAMASIAGAIAGAAAAGAKSFAELGAAALDAASQIAQALIIEIALRAAKSAVEKGSIFGAIAAVAVAAIAIAGLNALVDSVKPKKFAEGTNNAPGGLSLVGERGPELVNLSRGAQVIPNHNIRNSFGQSDVSVTGTFRVAGTDLLVVLERAQSRSKRTRGF